VRQGSPWTVRPWILAAALAFPLAARADGENPGSGGYFYFGLGGHLLAARGSTASGLSLESLIEVRRIILEGTVLLAVAGSQGVYGAGFRAGYVFTDGPSIAPFATVGVLRVGEGFPITGTAVDAYAVGLEAGVLLFRGNRFGRLSLAAQAIWPTQHATVGIVTQHDWYAISLRAML